MPKFKTWRQVEQMTLGDRTRQVMARSSTVNRDKKIPSSLDRVASSLTLNNHKIKWSYLSKRGQVMRYGYSVQD